MAEESTEPSASRAPLRIAALCLLGFLALTAVVTHQDFAGPDRAARSFVQRFHHPALLGVMEQASRLGGRPGQAAVVAGSVVLLWPRRRRWAVALPVVMAGAGALQLLAKWAVDRPRPNLDPWGFPSAHVLSVVVLGGYLAYVSSLGSDRPHRRRLAVGASAAVVATVAFSRMYVDAHFLSDVLGGLAAGLAYLCVVIWVMRFVPRFGHWMEATRLGWRTPDPRVPAPSPADAALVTAAAAAVARAAAVDSR